MARNVIAEQHQHPSIWAQMSYVPPRGPCFQKSSFLTSCPCFRFMIHPLKAATSFECDGCGHHASFHKMDNKQDEEYERQWKSEQQAQDAAQAARETARRTMAANVGAREPEQRQRQQRQIDDRGFELLEDDLRIVGDDKSVVQPASKKRRTTGR
ncbi:MAG: hypothetical protein Q9218_008304 [Villophora microphyllina]